MPKIILLHTVLLAPAQYHHHTVGIKFAVNGLIHDFFPRIIDSHRPSASQLRTINHAASAAPLASLQKLTRSVLGRLQSNPLQSLAICESRWRSTSTNRKRVNVFYAVMLNQIKRLKNHPDIQSVLGQFFP